MSRRQEIVDILTNRLKSISVANGFSNDILKVEEWAAAKINDKDMPALVLRDTSSSTQNKTSGSTTYDLKIEIDVMVSEKDTTMQALRTIMSDILKVIGAESDDLPEYRTYDGDEILAEHQDKYYGGARMKFTVLYDASSWEI